MSTQNLESVEKSLDTIARTLARLLLVQTGTNTVKAQVKELRSLGFDSAKIADVLGIAQYLVNQHAYLARKSGKRRVKKGRAKR